MLGPFLIWAAHFLIVYTTASVADVADPSLAVGLKSDRTDRHRPVWRRTRRSARPLSATIPPHPTRTPVGERWIRDGHYRGGLAKPAAGSLRLTRR